MKPLWVAIAIIALVLVGSLQSLTVHGRRPMWGPDRGAAAAWRQWLVMNVVVAAVVLIGYLAFGWS